MKLNISLSTLQIMTAAAFLGSCTPYDSGVPGATARGSGAATPVLRAATVVRQVNSLAELAQLNVPILQSSWMQQNWGGPQTLQVLADGGYRIIYQKANSLNYLMIEASPQRKSNPATPPSWSEELETRQPDGSYARLHPQSWRYANILGQTVRWYKANDGGGANFPSYQTVYFQALAPDGRSASYRIQVDTVSETSAAQWIGQVDWLMPSVDSTDGEVAPAAYPQGVPIR